MSEYLIVVDVQNDFVSGALGTAEAEGIVSYVEEKVKNYQGVIIFTRDTHDEHYLETQEGIHLPIPHCTKGTNGWELASSLQEKAKSCMIIDKPNFSSLELISYLQEQDWKEPIAKIELVGLCTDICVISNGLLLKAFFPEIPIVVDSKGCAGVTKDAHQAALEVMKSCQIEVV